MTKLTLKRFLESLLIFSMFYVLMVGIIILGV